MPIHEIERGFVPWDGIAENNFLLARILKDGRVSEAQEPKLAILRQTYPKDGNTVTSETAIVLPDFAGTFDSVGHVHLFATLERLGVCDAYQRVFGFHSTPGGRRVLSTDLLRKGCNEGQPG
ncbi:hypothetical protein AVEN_58018-1 [Araneus ventricosus]|uniref:Uncharacterized protein n=1 Tax=Araneus ventricosus TaxID=182803 RepID=A0A4Y2CF08_ARAVE|nr:hypothetical protein AVEN_6338-1 [Araneus ventricosus]GBM02337.1 hypothetical protein AVEN_58018-1 [Araneus ventricosus]